MQSTQTPPTAPTPPLILTRYLYDKHKVCEAIKQAVLQGNQDKTLFWVYELYFSGFIEDVIYIAFEMYDKYYKQRYPKLKAFLAKKARELRESQMEEEYPDDSFIGTIFHNMAICIPRLYESEPAEPWKGPRKYILISLDEIEPYRTQTAKQLNVPTRRFLKQVCKYSCMTQTPPSPTIDICPLRLRDFREKWEYYASETPYWQNIFLKYGADFDAEDGKILFDSEENEELFYEKYAYEPDEQSLIVQQYCLGWGDSS